MADKKQLKVEVREVMGRKVKNLKKDGLIAGNIYGSDVKSIAIQMNMAEVSKLWREMGETQVLYLHIGDEKKARPVLFDEVKRDPIKQEILHITFRQVNLKEKIEAAVAIKLVGENNISGAMVAQVHETVTVLALPTDLPEEFEINVEDLTEIGQAVTFADLKIDPEKVELVVSEEEKTSPVVILQEVKEEVEEEEESEGSEGEVATEGGESTEETAEASGESQGDEKGEVSNEAVEEEKSE